MRSFWVSLTLLASIAFALPAAAQEWVYCAGYASVCSLPYPTDNIYAPKRSDGGPSLNASDPYVTVNTAGDYDCTENLDQRVAAGAKTGIGSAATQKSVGSVATS
jgi:hypothetical protein